MDDFRRFFLRGLAALVPTLLTIAVLIWAYRLVNDYVGVHVTEGLVQFCSWMRAEPATELVDSDKDALEYGTPIDEWNALGQRLTIEHKVIHHSALADESVPAEARKAAWEARQRAMWHIFFTKYRVHLVGFVIAILVVYFTGFFLASFIGRTVWRAGERLINRIPLIRAIYPHIKQVTDFLLSERKRFAASGVVAVQYPRKGVWSLGLATGSPLKRVQEAATEDLVTVFIPSSPTPVTGYVIQIPRTDVIELNVSVDEALRFTVSGGVIKPGERFPGLGTEDDDD